MIHFNKKETKNCKNCWYQTRRSALQVSDKNKTRNEISEILKGSSSGCGFQEHSFSAEGGEALQDVTKLNTAAQKLEK